MNLFDPLDLAPPDRAAVGHRSVLATLAREFVRQGTMAPGPGRTIRRAADAPHLADHAGDIGQHEASAIVAARDGFMLSAEAFLPETGPRP